MSHETLLVDIRDAVATITLNRPQRFNAYTVRMGVELFGSLAELDERDDVRAIIVTGAGKHFCAGADLETGGDTFAGGDTWSPTAALEARVQPWNMRTPVIAAINGAAVGIGATLPLQWDFRLASERAKIGFVFTRRGIIPEAGSTWILPRLIGIAPAMDLMITGRIVKADEALALGLVNRVVPGDDLEAAARALATDIARNTAPVSVAITKQLLWRQLMESDPVRGKRTETELFYWSGKQADAAEGVESFLEKRAPRWTGKVSSQMPEQLKELDGDERA